MQKKSGQYGRIQTIKNIISNVLFIVADTLISLWYTPYLLNNLGNDLFGFIAIANSITNYLSLITYSINIPIGRLITIEIEKGEVQKANLSFNTNLFISLFLIALSTPLSIIMVIFSPILFNIPRGFESQVQLLFIGVFGSFLFGTYRLNFNVATFVKNRFDIRNGLMIFARIAQVLIVIWFFEIDKPNLVHIGISVVCATSINLIGDYYIWKFLLPELRIRIQDFRKNLIRPLFITGFWSFGYQAGLILFQNTDILIANQILDLNTVGMYAALLTIPKTLRTLSNSLGGTWAPAILVKYGNSDHLGVDTTIKNALKITGIFIALPIGLICGFSQPFLNVWLGANFNSMNIPLILMIFPLSTNLLSGIFFNVMIASNQIKTPSLSVIFIGIINLILGFLFVRLFGIMGIVLASTITYTIYSSFFMPVYAAIISNLSWSNYFRQLMDVSVLTGIVAVIAFLFSKAISLNSYVKLSSIGLLISVGYFIGIFFLAFNLEEKKMINNSFLKYFEQFTKH